MMVRDDDNARILHRLLFCFDILFQIDRSYFSDQIYFSFVQIEARSQARRELTFIRQGVQVLLALA